GYPVHVISRPLPGDRQFDGTVPYAVCRSAHGEESSWRRWRYLSSEIDRLGSDIIFSNVLGSGSVLGPLLARRKNKRFLISAHGMDLSRRAPDGKLFSTGLRSLRQWISYRGADRILCHCSRVHEILTTRKVDPARLCLLFPGVSRDFLEATPGDRLEIRRRWDLEGKQVVLTLCRLVQRKGIHLMLAAIARMAPRHPELVYLIAGDGPYRSTLEQLTQRLGIQSRVIFAGPVSQTEKLECYDAADLFAMPNIDLEGDCEGFGLVFVEAAARGLPAIGGRAGGVPDAIVDGETGLLVEPGDVDGLTTALESLLSDPGRRREMGIAARRRVSEHFTWEKTADQLIQKVLEAE
ncbi:MAG TPA: glycosyltransferase family 4 protein, partial [Acidobacteriota bacterium]|nr:glycosyltransferase family 4 protein [Acidobacteriota bacterium]